MDWITVKSKITSIIQKYKYVIVILCVGVLLLTLPSLKDKQEPKEVIIEPDANILSVEEQLSQILSYVQGAGKVQVMLSISSGEETLYQTDGNHTNNQDSASTKTDTVTVTDSDRNEAGLIRQVNPPVYAGAIVVCQGADNPSVRYAIVEAVSKATGLGADKISVLKMK